ncbi:MAG: hypothetical protein AAFX05_13345, partial [Planctomycetota bacterium]
LLAERGQVPPTRTRLAVYDLASGTARRMSLRSPIARGTLLGRSSDDIGFLVEQVQPDGTRRIGRARWQTGEIDWLVDDGLVNACGGLRPGGELVYSTRPIDSRDFRLASTSGRVFAEDGSSYLFPMVDDELTYAMQRSGFGLELQALSTSAQSDDLLDVDDVQDGWFVVARRLLTSSPAAVRAYQAADPMREAARRNSPPGLLFFHPGAGRMAIYVPGTGDLIPLVDRSIAGAWARDQIGWAVLLTTPDGLKHQRLRGDRDGWEALEASKTLREAHVPRALAEDSSFLLIGPSPRGDRMLTLTSLRLLPEEPESIR